MCRSAYGTRFLDTAGDPASRRDTPHKPPRGRLRSGDVDGAFVEYTPLGAADQILSWVEEATPEDLQVPIRDRNDALLCAAYGRAYRCFRSIRDLAARGEADDATILSRALVSIALQALWLAEPDEQRERDRRHARAALKYLQEVEKLEEEDRELQKIYDQEPAVRSTEAKSRAMIDRLEALGVNPPPPDEALARKLNFRPFYTRIYRVGSDVAHYSIGSALDGFMELTAKDEDLVAALVLPDYPRAEKILVSAALAYGAFLEQCESVIEHGLTDRIADLLDKVVEQLDEQSAE